MEERRQESGRRSGFIDKFQSTNTNITRLSKKDYLPGRWRDRDSKRKQEAILWFIFFFFSISARSTVSSIIIDFGGTSHEITFDR